MATLNSFDQKYYDAISGIAKKNNTDISTASSMFRSNLNGTGNYGGGGVVDFNQAKKDLSASLTKDISTPTTDGDLYALQEKSRINALETAKQNTLNALNNQKAQIDPKYNQALSTVGGQSAQSARNIQEYLAQRGLTNSGASAQAQMNNQANLNTNIAGIEQQRANAFSDIATQQANAENTYNQGVSEAHNTRLIAEAEAYKKAQDDEKVYQRELMLKGVDKDNAIAIAKNQAQLNLANSLAEIRANSANSMALARYNAGADMQLAQYNNNADLQKYGMSGLLDLSKQYLDPANTSYRKENPALGTYLNSLALNQYNSLNGTNYTNMSPSGIPYTVQPVNPTQGLNATQYTQKLLDSARTTSDMRNIIKSMNTNGSNNLKLSDEEASKLLDYYNLR